MFASLGATAVGNVSGVVMVATSGEHLHRNAMFAARTGALCT